MPKTPRFSGKEVIARLAKFGFVKARQRGSHVVLKKNVPGGAIGCVVPLHPELATGTLHGILRQAQIDLDIFLKPES